MTYDEAVLLSVSQKKFLLHVEPGEPLSNWTLAPSQSNTYRVAWNHILSGRYRKLIRMVAEDVELTSRTSVALVEANVNSFFHDEVNQWIYIHVTGAVDPDTLEVVFAIFRFHFGVPDQVINSIYYEKGWLLADDAIATDRRPDLVIGRQRTGDGAISLDNTDAFFDTLTTTLSWKNKKVSILFGLDGIDFSEYKTIRTFVIDDVIPTETEFKFDMKTVADFFERRMPPTPHFGANLGEGVVGTRVRIHYGAKENVPPDLVDDSGSQRNIVVNINDELDFTQYIDITPTSNIVDFTESGVRVCRLRTGRYDNLQDMAAQWEEDMNRAAQDNTYSIDVVGNKLRVTRVTGSQAYSLDWNSNPSGNNAATNLGFDDSADDSGSTTYTADFDREVGIFTATITASTYASGTTFASEIQSRMNAAQSTNVYAASFGTKITIARSSGILGFDLNFATGPNAVDTMGREAGFNTDEDKINLLSYVGDVEIVSPKYRFADQLKQALYSIDQIVLRNTSTEESTTLLITQDFTQDLNDCSVTIIRGGATPQPFSPGTHEVRGDVKGPPASGGDTSTDYKKFRGEVARWLVTNFTPLEDADLDLASFSAADTQDNLKIAASQKEETTLRAMLRLIEASGFGSVSVHNDGLVEFRIWDPGIGGGALITLNDEDFVEFNSNEKFEVVFSEIQVLYDQDPAETSSFEVETVTNDRTRFLQELENVLRLETVLKDQSAAQVLAQRLALLYRDLTTEIAITERGIRLMDICLCNRVRVNKSRAPSEQGEYVNRLMDIIELEKRLGSVDVFGILGDLRGIGEAVGLITQPPPEPGAPTWLNATEEEKLVSGFITDDQGRADPTDESSKGVSIIW